MQFSSSIVNIITAVASLFTAIALVIGSFTTYRKAKEVERKVDDVHTIVNQQRTDAQNYQRALVRALTNAGVDVPADQSLEDK